MKNETYELSSCQGMSCDDTCVFVSRLNWVVSIITIMTTSPLALLFLDTFDMRQLTNRMRYFPSYTDYFLTAIADLALAISKCRSKKSGNVYIRNHFQ